MLILDTTTTNNSKDSEDRISLRLFSESFAVTLLSSQWTMATLHNESHLLDSKHNHYMYYQKSLLILLLSFTHKHCVAVS